MKHKTITTDKATLLVVEMPEGKIHGFKVTEIGNLTFFKYDELKGSFPIVKQLPKGNWKLLGRLPDITEDQALKVVEEYTYNTGEVDGYFRYENDGQTDCPIESLESLLYVNKVYNTFDINRIHLFIKVD